MAIATPTSIFVGFLIARRQLENAKQEIVNAKDQLIEIQKQVALAETQLKYTKEDQEKQTKFQQANLFFTINEIFLKPEYRKVSSAIYEEVYEGKKLKLTKKMIKSLTNYLNDLEFLADLWTRDILTLEQIDVLNGLQVTQTMKSTTVVNFIKKEEEKMQVDLYGGLRNLNLALIDFQINSTNIPLSQ